MELIEGYASIDDVTAFVERLDSIGTTHDVAVQAFDARYVAGRAHLEAAVRAANRAIEHDDAIATDRSIEILLYAAGRRQIDRALEMGVSEGERPVVVLVDGEHEEAAAAPARELLEPEAVLGTERDEETIREFFSITDDELAATDASLCALVIERVALLAVEK